VRYAVGLIPVGLGGLDVSWCEVGRAFVSHIHKMHAVFVP